MNLLALILPMYSHARFGQRRIGLYPASRTAGSIALSSCCQRSKGARSGCDASPNSMKNSKEFFTSCNFNCRNVWSRLRFKNVVQTRATRSAGAPWSSASRHSWTSPAVSCADSRGFSLGDVKARAILPKYHVGFASTGFICLSKCYVDHFLKNTTVFPVSSNRPKPMQRGQPSPSGRALSRRQGAGMSSQP